ncbi:unnamed protein product [Nippostrongylus brasiliensis]|uniref:Protein kinase domain-containing protein n=1 Tax=Nippostrongylus brasiliensis TaxID=27835 RepID=A0A0N4XJW5_NIPBR|nr:unnamed protein product [Nippostrongylus brasiliensis]
MLFSRDRSLETLDKLANVLRDSVENKFISIESTDIYNYCDLSGVPEFRAGYPTPKEELGLKAGVKYRLLHENRITEFSNSFEKPTHGSPPILFPLLDDIPWTPKKWGLSLDEGWQTNGEQSNHGHRMAAFAQAGEALKDCEKISEIVATSSTTIRTLLDMIKIELESARERTLIPVRFTTYAKMHSFALTPFVRDESQKVVIDRIFEVADEAAKTLEVCTEFFNKALADIVVHLKELNSIELDIDEEPGLEDELNSMLNDAPPDGLLEYERELINHCLIRRASLASQLCSNSNNSIVRVLLRAARFAVDLRTELTRYEKCVDDCTMQIERPFQELKSCVVRMQADMNLDELSFRKAVNYYKRPSNIINHTRQIHGQVHRLLQLIQQGGEPSQ